jgi:hypothetical protein
MNWLLVHVNPRQRILLLFIGVFLLAVLATISLFADSKLHAVLYQAF